MTPPRRAKLVLLVLAVALIGLGVWAWEPLWMWVTTKKVLFPEAIITNASGRFRIRGWASDSRWTGSQHGWQRTWYVETGFKAEATLWNRGIKIQSTVWSPDGNTSLHSGGKRGSRA